MKYYLIAGEASGDLHASHLMRSLQQEDAEAEFRFFGGDLMASVGGHRVKHYRELAYMGFIPVLLHLPTILRNMRMCKQDIVQWQPDVVILVDYPGFNLSIAKYIGRLKAKGGGWRDNRPQVFYYISPKIWAWKEYRIKNIKRDVDRLYSILPFEKEFFEQKHHYPIDYVGNPTADEVREFLRECVDAGAQGSENTPSQLSPTIALLAGSRKQEIKDNLPAMLQATRGLSSDYRLVIAGAPGIEPDYYDRFTKDYNDVGIVFNETYRLLKQSHAALVTSGTATLETALFRVPQVVCYETPLPRLIGFLRKRLLKVKYVSLVNLIAGREVVPELVAERFGVDAIRSQLLAILDGQARETQLQGYDDVLRILGDKCAPQQAARLMTTRLMQQKSKKY